VAVSGRHLLLEGPPGIGKTTVARILAGLLPSMEVVSGCRYNCDPVFPQCPECLGSNPLPEALTISGKRRFIRVQGSPELMPEDLLGDIDPVVAMQCGIHDPQAFTPGKIQKAHRKILFIDELNRVPERTQNTLIEVLEERTTTIAGFELDIFVDTIVIATQNPEEYAGAERISETLGDRFERIHIGYPTEDEEIQIIKQYARRLPDITVKDSLVSDAVKMSQATRSSDHFSRPASVRASIATYEQSQAIARLNGRNSVTPDDVMKAARISLESRTEISPDSRFYGSPGSLFGSIIEGGKAD
jgi:Mg-chelatase subunit ChlI